MKGYIFLKWSQFFPLQLIEEECLYFRIEKIPPNIYKSYEIDCKKEAENLLKGILAVVYCFKYTQSNEVLSSITLLSSLSLSAISVHFNV